MRNDIAKNKTKRSFLSIGHIIKIACNGQFLIAIATICGLIIANCQLSNYLPLPKNWMNLGNLTNYNISFNNFLLLNKPISINLSPLAIVNDFLMTFFFLIIGIEIKHEAYFGSLANKSARVLPIIGAISGVIVPMGVYLAISIFHSNYTSIIPGFPTPCATDIAFSIAAIQSMKGYIPRQLQMFIITLAIVDDLISILIITIFYTKISFTLWSIILLSCCALMILCGSIFNIKRLTFYCVILFTLWLALELSNIHPTISGVIVAIIMPINSRKLTEREEGDNKDKESNNEGGSGEIDEKDSTQCHSGQCHSSQFTDDALSPSHTAYNLLSPFVSYIVLPLFAFFNSQVSIFSSFNSSSLDIVLILAVSLGLFLGKQWGIYLVLSLSKFMKIQNELLYVSRVKMYVGAMLCGIGFTMSIFIAILSFPGDILLLESAKIGVIIGSLISFLGAHIIAYIDRICK